MEGSPEHVLKCGRSNPTKPEHSMSEPEPLPEHLDRLGGEAQSVLAVLILAALWPSRYPDGWVSVRHFARVAVLLGERADQESLKAAIRRGLRQLGQIRGAPRVEFRRTHEHDPVSARPRRDRERRLSDAVCPSLEAWLLRAGPELISADIWRQYLPVTAGGGGMSRSEARSILRHTLKQADACLGLAAHVLSRNSPEGRLLARIRRSLSTGLRGVRSQSDRNVSGPETSD